MTLNGRSERVWDEKYQKWIDVVRVNPSPKRPGRRAARRKPFKADWVKLPDYWIEQLERSRRVGPYKLAHRILREAFKQQHRGGEVVLSTAVTGMPRATRHDAVKVIVGLGLIRIKQEGRGAVVVTELLLADDKSRRARRGKNGK
jgi:hypothetical protein